MAFALMTTKIKNKNSNPDNKSQNASLRYPGQLEDFKSGLRIINKKTFVNFKVHNGYNKNLTKN